MIERCKNCGGKIEEEVVSGKSKWIHKVDFGDCIAEPDTNPKKNGKEGFRTKEETELIKKSIKVIISDLQEVLSEVDITHDIGIGGGLRIISNKLIAVENKILLRS